MKRQNWSLYPQKGDDTTFIRNCEIIIQNRINHWNPKELFIINIDIFFNSDTIKYDGSNPDVFSFWSCGDQLKVSKYHPLYVISTTIFQRTYKGYEEITATSYIKKRKKEEYDLFENSYGIKRYNFKPIEDGLIVYYTKDSLYRDEGSIVFFYKNHYKYDSVFVGLHKNNNWGVLESNGIQINEVQQMINENTITNI